ncbi:MAG: cache domain-containing protein [Fibrobacterota bacterium]
MLKKIFATMLVLVGIAAATPKDDATALVNDASKFLKANGKEKALQEINKPDGKWVKGELYVFAYDFQGVIVAHPKNAKLVGKNMLEVPDVDGKLFRKDIVEAAKSKGTGWVDYKYKNPETGKIEEKTTFVLKSGDVILCCGIYRD